MLRVVHLELLDVLLESEAVPEALQSEENPDARVDGLVLDELHLLHLVAADELQVVVLHGGLEVVGVQVEVLVLCFPQQEVSRVVLADESSREVLGLDEAVEVLDGLLLYLVETDPEEALYDERLPEVAVAAELA